MVCCDAESWRWITSPELVLALNHELTQWSTKQGSQHSWKTWIIREKFGKFEKSGNLEISGKIQGKFVVHNLVI